MTFPRAYERRKKSFWKKLLGRQPKTPLSYLEWPGTLIDRKRGNGVNYEVWGDFAPEHEPPNKKELLERLVAGFNAEWRCDLVKSLIEEGEYQNCPRWSGHVDPVTEVRFQPSLDFLFHPESAPSSPHDFLGVILSSAAADEDDYQGFSLHLAWTPEGIVYLVSGTIKDGPLGGLKLLVLREGDPQTSSLDNPGFHKLYSFHSAEPQPDA